MSSARKMQARRRGQRQQAQARRRAPVLQPPRQPSLTAELVPLALYRPQLSVNGLREVLDAARDVDPSLTKVYLNIRDMHHLAVGLDRRLVYSSEIRAVLSHALNITVQEHRGVPQGGAVLENAYGRTEYLAPHSKENDA